ncbi:MAG TPA: cyclase family protein [Nitrososphaerales archaeon]|nr:cyclase family protein [Nitrososphaerales archaeon]
MSREEFDKLFEEVCNWGRWGAEDEKGTLNYLTPAMVKKGASKVKSGRTISMSRSIETSAASDNATPAVHRMTRLYQTPTDGTEEPQFVSDFLGGDMHGNAYSHFDALCHVSYRGRLYNDRPTEVVTPRGAKSMDVTQYRRGIVGRGVLLDIPRLRKVKWLEPGESVSAEELEEAEKSEGVRLGQGDVFAFRVGHSLRRLELGAWDVEAEGRAGLDPAAMRLLHKRKVSAFLPDADGETVPSPVEGVRYPVHALQIASMGLACGDSFQLEDLSRACQEEKRWEFMVAVSPLVIPGGTGSLVNPIAVF